MDPSLQLAAARLTGMQAALDQMIRAETSRPRHVQLVRLRGDVVSALEAVASAQPVSSETHAAA